MAGRRSDIIGVIDATGAGFAHGAQTINDAASAIPATNFVNRKAITIFNFSSTNTVYVGGSAVTSANGYPITPKQGLPFDLSSGAVLYGICESGKTAEIRVLEVNND